jgi:hypothetical protein
MSDANAKGDALFDKAMIASGFTTAEARMAREVGIHAGTEALTRMVAICETLPNEQMEAASLLYAMSQVRNACDAQIKEATRQFAAVAAENLIRRRGQ